MTRLIDHALVAEHCPMGELVDAIKRGLREEADGRTTMPPRQNIPMDHGLLRMMPVAMNGSGLFGFKVFHTSTTGARYLVALYEQEGGELLALVDGDHLTALRTGATAGVAARHMARPEASSVGVIGAGVEARTNFAAMAAVRSIERAFVFSPRASSREAFAAETRELYDIDARAVDSPQAAVEGADIVIVATNTMAAADPIAFRAAWREPGMHVSSIGSTLPILRELDVDTFAQADRVVVDAPEQMANECGDVIAAIEAGAYPEDVVALQSIVAGEIAGRDGADEITLFKSLAPPCRT